MPDLGSVTGLPSWHPPLELLEIAELVLSGVLGGPPGPIDGPAFKVPAELNDVPIVVLEDAEGTPVATLERSAAGGQPRFGALRSFSHGPARTSRRTPAQVRAELRALGDDDGPARAGESRGPGESGGVLGVPVTSLLGAEMVEAVLAEAGQSGQVVLWLAIFGAGRESALPGDALWRAVRSVAIESSARGVRSIAVGVAVPKIALAQTGPDDAALLDAVARAYGATDVHGLGSVEPGSVELDPAFARALDRAVPPPGRRGVTVFFTGLSGSGKSTVARGLAARLAERSDRTFSLLDGDEVRRLLSAGLGFTRVDRDLNIRRIGFVATEVSRHGGLAICAPIAPFAQTRAQVRAAVEEVGDFVLIHISTPLAECERRDRKGLYAKARQGLIPDFTGISSPYEVPLDPELRLDTSRIQMTEAVDAVWELLASRGYLDRP